MYDKRLCHITIIAPKLCDTTNQTLVNKCLQSLKIYDVTVSSKTLRFPGKSRIAFRRIDKMQF